MQRFELTETRRSDPESLRLGGLPQAKPPQSRLTCFVPMLPPRQETAPVAETASARAAGEPGRQGASRPAEGWMVRSDVRRERKVQGTSTSKRFQNNIKIKDSFKYKKVSIESRFSRIKPGHPGQAVTRHYHDPSWRDSSAYDLICLSTCTCFSI